MATSSTGAAGVWEKFVDDDTKATYYYNKRTGESSWETPEGYVEADTDPDADAANRLPPKWRKFEDDSSGKPYYYDEANDVTQWDEPEGFVEDAADDEKSEEDGANEHSEEESDDEERAPVREPPAETAQSQQQQPNEQETTVRAGDKPEDSTVAAATPDTITTEGVSAPAAPSTAQVKWVKHMDPASGKPYYHDTMSNTTQWDEPTGFVDAPAAAAPVMSAAAAEYQAHLNRVRTERLTRVTQRVLDPTGSLGRLNAILSGINPGNSGAVDAEDSVTSGDGDVDGDGSSGGGSKAEWQQHVDPHTQRFYYHNVVTGETQWQKPDAPVVSGLADWVPPEVTDPTASGANRKTVSGVNYAARAKFNRVTGKYEQLGGDEYWQSQGVAPDRAGRQMSHFFNMTDLEKNRADAKVLKEKLKRKNIDWKKVAAEKKAKKQKQKNEWIYQD